MAGGGAGVPEPSGRLAVLGGVGGQGLLGRALLRLALADAPAAPEDAVSGEDLDDELRGVHRAAPLHYPVERSYALDGLDRLLEPAFGVGGGPLGGGQAGAQELAHYGAGAV